MGAQASRGVQVEQPDERAVARAWREGVPFTLLHDEAFVVEKYQELVVATGMSATTAISDKAGEQAEATFSGMGEVPRDEAQHEADMARIRLFARQRGKDIASTLSNGSAGSSPPSSGVTKSSERESNATALAAMMGTTLSLEAPGSAAREKLRTQRVAIIQSYFEQVAARVKNAEPETAERVPDAETAAHDNEETAASSSLASSEQASSLQSMQPSLLGDESSAILQNVSAASVFSVSSFRMQLEMLRELRVMLPRMFECGTLAFVQTLLDSAPFALSDIAAGSPEEALLEDAHRFCQDMLQSESHGVQSLPDAQRQVLLLLLLALGTSSGRISILLEFVDALLAVPSKSLASNDTGGLSWRGHPFIAWVDVFVRRIQSFRIDFTLGTFEDDAFVKKFIVKALPRTHDTGVEEGADASDEESRAGSDTRGSIATDGNFAYTWSLEKGLAKVGTGLNFTIAGRVYAEAPAARYLQLLNEQLEVNMLVYGFGDSITEVTDVVRKEVARCSQQPAGSAHSRTVCDLLAGSAEQNTAGTAMKGKLLVSFRIGEKYKVCTFDAEEVFDFTVLHHEGDGQRGAWSARGGVAVCRAWYGDMEILSSPALAEIRKLLGTVRASGNDDEEGGETGIAYSRELLEQLLTLSNISLEKVSDSKHLMVIFGADDGSGAKGARILSEGDRIGSGGDRCQEAFFSSLVFSGDSLYLSLLHPDIDCIGLLNAGDRGARPPRRLIRINPDDLAVLETLSLDADSASTGMISAPATRLVPVWTYVTEGRLIYEIEMTADRFGVSVFTPKVTGAGGKHLEFVRSFDLHLHAVESNGLSLCLVGLRNRKMSETKLEFSVPVFYTNGALMGMLFTGTDSVEDSPTKDNTTCVLFDCDDGHVKMSCDGDIDKACLTRSIPLGSVSFDARNNFMWLFAQPQSTLLSYRNTGRKISLNEVDAPTEHMMVLPADRTAGTATGELAEKAALVLLGTLDKNAEVSDLNHGQITAGEARKPRTLVPFAVDLNVSTFQVLLAFTSKYVALLEANTATTGQMYALQSCLGLLNTNLEQLLSCPDSPQKQEALATLQTGLSTPLEILLQLASGTSGEGGHEVAVLEQLEQVATIKESERVRAQVASATLDLYTTSIHVFHADVNKQLANVLKHLELWQQAKATAMELKILARLLAHLCSRAEVIYHSMQRADDNLQQFVKLVEFAVEVQIQQLRRAAMAVNTTKGAAKDATTLILRDNEEASSQLLSLVNGIMQAAFAPIAITGIGTTRQAFGVAFAVFGIVCKACARICSDAAKYYNKPQNQSLLEELKDGFFGTLMPIILSCGVSFLRSQGKPTASLRVSTQSQSEEASDEEHDGAFSTKKDVLLMREHFLEFLQETASRMQTVMENLERLVESIAPGQREEVVENISTVLRVETMESSHQYENNMNVLTELQLPGASSMTITFDQQTRTEAEYDYITFFKDKSRGAHYGDQCYSGRDSEHNWPGVGENPPLTIESDHCFVLFHTDSSNTDWGYKFRATAEIVEKRKMLQQHWLVFLQEGVVEMLDETIKLFVDGALFAPMEKVEVENEHVLQSDLLKSGECPDDIKNAMVFQLLQDFVDPPKASGAEKVINALLEKSGSPRKNVAIQRSSSFKAITSSAPNYLVNRAVRAVAAAILHHNMCGMDAHAFATDLRSDISQQLLRGWKNAQKIRDWFHLGDAAKAAISTRSMPNRQQSKRLRRQPSAFKGLTEESLEILCNNVIERAEFLLEMRPVSFAYVKGARRRWGLLAKYGYAIGKHGNADSPLEKWYNLVDELQAATNLTSFLRYRRSSSERHKPGMPKSVTEQVLEFIQSDVDVRELRQIRAARNQRATVRALGLEYFGRALESCPSMRLQGVLLESFASTIKSIALNANRDDNISAVAAASADTVVFPRLHFDTSLSGCDEVLHQRIAEAFGRCLSIFSLLLSFTTANDNDVNSALTMSALKCCAIDYDVEDSYLLEESRALPQILLLLSSKSVRTRHAAQSLLGLLISRFFVRSASSSNDANGQGLVEGAVSDVSTLQGQLASAIGLQLEHIVSGIQASLDTDHGSDTRNSVPQYLPECSPGLVAACSHGSSVGWNHSILLWVYASRQMLVYALKVGDEVQPGPDWSVADEIESDEKKTGVVVGIPSPTSVQVHWKTTAVSSECVYDPKHGTFEVILANEEGLGGTIFFKGNKKLVAGSGSAKPWSHLGLYLNDKRMLVYKIGCGGDKECVYETSCELEADEWAHVAIVQEKDSLKIFVNGSIASQHLLDPFLTVAGNEHAADSVIIESAHPFENSVDQYFPVHIPGATSIRVTFDPLCDIDSSTGFVRLHKDSKCVEHWGEHKYTGKYNDPKRKFPGGQSHHPRSREQAGAEDAVALSDSSAVEIASDRFVVYFHNEGSSSGWGFRLLASPEFPDTKRGTPSSAGSLNPYPFYFGEAPNRVHDEPAAKCWIYAPKVLSFPISENELTAEIQATCPSTEHPSERPPRERTLHILGLMRTCTETPNGRSIIGTPENIRNLMLLTFDERVPVEVCIASMRVLTELAGLMAPETVDSQFKRCFPGTDSSFMAVLLSRLAEGLNVWHAYHEDQHTPFGSNTEQLDGDNAELEDGGRLELRRSAQSETSLMAGYISLIHAMVDFFDWRNNLMELMRAALEPFRSLNGARAELSASVVGPVLASLALLGGNYHGVCIGGRVKCCVDVDGTSAIETGSLVEFRMERGEHMARVLFDSDPTKPVAISVDSIAHMGDEEQRELTCFIARLAPFTAEIMEFYESVLRTNANESSTEGSYQTKLSKKENVEVLESTHPYAEGEDVTYPLKFSGAREIVVYFDQMSCTAGPNDYVQFIKRDEIPESTSDVDNNKTKYWGEDKYSGESFPGVGGTPPLTIPAGSVDVHFHTEGSSNTISEWGFKLTAHAFEEKLTHPPEVPPPIMTSVLSDIRSRCLKSLGLVLRAQKEVGALSAFEPLLPDLAKIATTPRSGRPTQLEPESQVFESEHPYANSVLEQFEVSSSGASKLTITFDPQSRTEQGCDYLCFYKDKSLTHRWGAYKYSGRDESSNWPGTENRPSLVIPGDSFTLLWATDSSNVDWGWKFTVTATFLPAFPIDKTFDQLDCAAYQLFETLYERVASQRTPLKSEFEGFDWISDDEQVLSSQDPTRPLLSACCLTDVDTWQCRERANLNEMRQFRVTDAVGVKIHCEKSCEADVVATLDVGDEIAVDEHQGNWLKVSGRSTAKLNKGEVGWVRQRSGDTFHVVSRAAFRRVNDLLVLGIDDINLEDERSVLEMDDSSDAQSSVANFCTPFDFDMLNGQTDRSQSQAYDLHGAIAAKAARDAVFAYLSCDMNETPVSLGKLGSVDDILLLLSHYFVKQNSVTTFDREGSVLPALMKRFQFAVGRCDEDPIITSVVKRCLEVLQSSARLLPKGRGAMQVVESAHPYHDNTDQYWSVHIPGAKRIKVVFDRRCKTESGCDWMCFYKPRTNRTSTVGPEQIGGRDEDANWPGIDSRPPLYIEGDEFEVYFHSDSTNTDWGFNICAIGIFENEADPPHSEEGVAESEVCDPTLAVGLLSTVGWVLEVITTAAESSFCAGSATLKTLLSAEMLQTLIMCLEDSPQCIRMRVLRVLTNLCQWSAFHTLPVILVEKVCAVITAKLRVRHQAEDRAEVKSPFMQTLVQCAVTLDLAIDSRCFEQPPTARVAGTPPRLLSKPVGCSDGRLCSSSSTRGCHQFQLVFRKFIPPVTLCLAGGLASSSDMKPVILVRWNDAGRFSVARGEDGNGEHSFVPVTNCTHRIQEDDKISIQLDVNHQTLILRTNNVVAAEIAGSGAPIRWEMLRPWIADASVACLVVKQANAETQIELSALHCSPLALLPRATMPSWYKKIIDAVGMMMDLRDARASSILTEESLHPLLPSATGASLKPRRNQICVSGAVALEIRFDKRTKLAKTDELHFFSAEDSVVSATDAKDPDVVFVGLDGELDEKQKPHLFVTETSKQNNAVLSVGDAVVRSLDWQYSDEDGGPGSVGIVQEITGWGGQSGKGVRVRWQGSDTEDVYRNGFGGCFDVQSLHRTRHESTPFIIRGSACAYEFHSSASASLHQNRSGVEVMFEGSVELDGKSQVVFELPGERGDCVTGSDCTVEFWACLATEPSAEVSRCADPNACVEVFRIRHVDGGKSMSLGINGEGGWTLMVQAPNVDAVVLDCQLQNAGTESAHRKPPTLHSGEWMHLALVLSGSNATVYKNGELCYLAECQRMAVLRTSLDFGRGCTHNVALPSGEMTRLTWLPFKGNLYDVRVWDVAFKAEQLRSHASGLDTVDFASISPSSWGGPRSTMSKPLSSSTASFSSPRLPGAQSYAIPPHMQKWVTANRSSKDVANVRLNCGVKTLLPSSQKIGLDTTVYYEVQALSSGKLSVGWIFGDVMLSSRTAMVGEANSAFAIEPAKKMAHFSGASEDLLPFIAVGTSGCNSPRRSFAGGSFGSDIFCREGNVIGCAFIRKSNVLAFFINGDLVAQHALPLFEESGTKLEVLVDEALSEGEVPTPRISSAFSEDSCSEQFLLPCASMGPLGAQGLVWNLGQRPFQYESAITDEELLSVLEAAGCSEDDAHFEIFDHAEGQWTPVTYRHKVQDIVPRLLGWWKLNDGTGNVFGDSSGNGYQGVLLSRVCEVEGEDQDKSSFWDETCIPPVAARRRNLGNVSPFSPIPLTVDAQKKTNTFWGYTFYVIPHFSEETVGRQLFQSPSLRFDDGPRNLLPRHDEQLARYVNKKAQSKGFNVTQVLHAAWSEIAPQEDELVRWPALVEIVTDAAATCGKDKLASSESGESKQGIEAVPLPSFPSGCDEVSVVPPVAPTSLRQARGDKLDRLAKRFKVLQEFNAAVFRILPFICFHPPTVGEDEDNEEHAARFMLSSLVTEQRHRILSLIKQPLWESELGRTSVTRDTFELTLNRPKTMRYRATGKVDRDGRHTLFSQAFRELHSMNAAYYRRAESLYHVTFLGENAQDAGGPYRETFAQYCEELQSGQLELLLPTPNSQHNVGVGRERWLLNPSASSPTELQMLEFLGKLMGASMRSKDFLSLNLAALIWKKLAGEHVGLDDLASVDAMLVSSMAKVRAIDRLGVTEEMFEDVVMETFTTLGADNRVLELKPNGAEIPVTFTSRCEYAELVQHARLHEGDDQARALLRGIARVVPAKLLSCFSGQELESMICGSPEVDVELLAQCTEYSGCAATDAHVVWFWSVLGAFSQEDRGAFLRFVWGRSRLPPTADDFSQRFKLQPFSQPRNTQRGLDVYLPVAHTCFFSLELPAYSSEDVLKDKLLYAIYNCQAIDGDGDSVQANQLGWEE